MEAFKEIVEAFNTDIKIHVPDSFRGKKLEVIVFPYDEKNEKNEFLSLSGSWADLDTDAMKQEILDNRKDIRRTDVNL